MSINIRPRDCFTIMHHSHHLFPHLLFFNLQVNLAGCICLQNKQLIVKDPIAFVNHDCDSWKYNLIYSTTKIQENLCFKKAFAKVTILYVYQEFNM